MAYVGRGVTFGVGVRVANPEHVRIGDNTWIDDYVVLLAGPPSGEGRRITRKPNPRFTGNEGELSIGSNCHIAQHVVLQGHGGLSVGDSSGVASGSRLYSLSHHYRDLGSARGPDQVFKFSPCVSPEEQALISSPVVMEEATAVGLNSVVLPGSTIGKGAWIGVLSLVVGNIPPNSLAVGNPAKVVKKIHSGTQAEGS